jgi:GNAT superfamily N-acetyltransferase
VHQGAGVPNKCHQNADDISTGRRHQSASADEHRTRRLPVGGGLAYGVRSTTWTKFVRNALAYIRSAEKVTTCFPAVFCDRKWRGGLQGKGARCSKSLACIIRPERASVPGNGAEAANFSVFLGYRHSDGVRVNIKAYKRMAISCKAAFFMSQALLSPSHNEVTAPMYVIHRHGALYTREYGFGMQFETYAAKGLCEFMDRYDPATNRVWVCEHEGRMVGFLLLMNRGEAAQLRYFLIEPEYRGMGLGSRLMALFMEFLKACNYRAAYLWTTHELAAASHLYTRAGFVLTEEKPSTAFGKPLTELRYDLRL